MQGRMEDWDSLRLRLSRLSSKSESKIMQSSKRSTVKLLDELCSIIVRLRDRECKTCAYQDPPKIPSRTDLTNGHYFHRGIEATRWNIINCHCQCEECNNLHEQDTGAYTRFIIDQYGESILEDLNALRVEHSRYSRADLYIVYRFLVVYGERLL